jgi:galactokinase
MMGGGFGGCTINLVRVDAVASFVDDVARGFESRFGYVPGTGSYALVGGARVHE